MLLLLLAGYAPASPPFRGRMAVSVRRAGGATAATRATGRMDTEVR